MTMILKIIQAVLLIIIMIIWLYLTRFIKVRNMSKIKHAMSAILLVLTPSCTNNPLPIVETHKPKHGVHFSMSYYTWIKAKVV